MYCEVASTAGVDKETLLGIVEPVLVAHGVDGVELTFKTERAGWVLRVTVETPTPDGSPGMLNLDLVAEISRDISRALDVDDTIPQAYNLEVSSPGVERNLRTLTDMDRFSGKLAKLVVHKALSDGQKVLRGVLEGTDGDTIQIRVDGKPKLLKFSNFKSGHLVFEFGAGPSKKGRGSSGKSRKHAKNTQRAAGPKSKASASNDAD